MKTVYRLLVMCALAAAWSASVPDAHAAVAQQVQSGTAVNSANGIQTITISSVGADTTKSVLFFQTRSNSNLPGGSTVRGRLASATTIEFERVTLEGTPATIDIQWYVVTFGSGVKVQRGEVAQSATTVNVTITAVASLSQAFVLWSKTPALATGGPDDAWGSDDAVLGELTTTSNLQFRADTANAGHTIAWQVVEFTTAADINVQKGSITTMTGTTTSVTATLSPAVNVDKTFVLIGWKTTGGAGGGDIGSRMLRAQLTNSTTITIDRSVSGSPDDITEIVWQAIELKDASTVWSGTSNFAAGVAQATAGFSPTPHTTVNTTRAVAFGSSQGGAGQNMGRTPYVGDDIIGVGSVTAALSATQITLDRNNTAAAADVGWFVVQFDRGSGFKVGSFTKSTGTAPVTQTIAHGLSEVPKALILWTEGRTNETFNSAAGIAFRNSASAGAGSGVLTLTINKPTGTVENDVMIGSIGAGPNTATVTAPAGWTLVRRIDNTIVFRAAASTGAGSGVLTLTINKPTGTLQNDVMVASIGVQPETATITAPSGWTFVRRIDNVGPTSNSLAVYRKVAGASEPASYDWTFNTSTGSAGGIQSFSGVDTTSPVDVEAGQDTVSALTHDAPSVTTTIANDMIVTSHTFASSATWTPPAGMTEAVDRASQGVPNAAGQSIEMNRVLQAAVGATGAKTATASNDADVGNTHTLALRPAAQPKSLLAVYRKVAGASEPANYAWTFDTSTGSAGGIQSFSGVDTTTPVNVEAGQSTASALTHDAPSVTTTMANDMIVTSHTFASSATWTPTGMTEAVDVASQGVPNAAGQSIEANYVLQAAVGATGAKTATASNDADVGNTHTLALRPAYPAYFGFGMTDGTTSKSVSTSSQNDAGTSNGSSRIANKALTIVKWGEVVLAEADLSSWDDTNFVLNWTTNDANAYVVHYIAIAGTDVSAKVVGWTMATATGNQIVAGVGFQPNVVIHAHAKTNLTNVPPVSTTDGAFGLGVMDADGDQWAFFHFPKDGQGTTDTQRGQQTDASIYAFDQAPTVTKRASWVSMNADGFTVDFTTANGSATQVFSLSLKGVNVKAGSFLKSTGGSPASQLITGVGFQPGAVLLTSFQDVTQVSPVSPVVHSRFGIGASDGTTQGSSAFADEDAVTPTNVDAIDKTSKVFVKVNNSTPAIDAEANLTSLDTDGFTLNWTTNDAVATQILYLALGRLDVTEVRLLSFNATRYNRGVLLQWRTGYEIDNLGFHVYREINGRRTRVNAALIAGSGLMAGRGTAVTAEQRYALWDLDGAAASGSVVYWLEDLDFNGKSTWHGPATPVAGSVVEPNVPASTELRELGRRGKARKVFVTRERQGERRGRPAWRTVPQTEIATQWALAAEAAVKIGVTRAGWYRIGQPDLVAAGIDPRVDPRTLRLFVDGVEQAIRVTGETDGRFDPGDAIEFYGTGVDTPYTDTRVYWLEAGRQRGQRIGAIGSVAANAGPAARGPASFPSTLQQKERSIYFAALRNGDTENWFGSLVSPDPTDLILTVSNVDPAPPELAQLDVALQGVTNTPDVSPDHRVGVLVNGTEVGELAFDGQEHGVQTFAMPPGVLREGENTVTLIARGGEADYSLFDTLWLSYAHSYRADADRLRFTVDVPGPATIGGFASSAIRVVDITDPAAAVELRGAVRTEGGGFSSVTVRVPGPGPRTLLAFTDATIASPSFAQANRPSNWHAPTQAHDYVVITHPNFADSVQPLAARRAAQGYHPAVVSVDQVYNEFSFGEKTPHAIKDFLTWAKANWRQSPRFVVLVGDATIDPRDYAGMGDADFVPTKQVPMVRVALETASDDWFADFDDDGLPELAVGRLPVRTADQAEAVVAKIVSYDQNSAQPWTKEVLLVADQNDDASNFEASSARLRALLPPDYTAHELFRGALTAETAHQLLVDRVNDGQLIVNYQGHGSVHIWGRDGELLTNDDVYGAWRNGNGTRLPLVVAMNCLNGFFHGIWDEESLAEALLRAPNGGAVAAWASSSVTSSATQVLVNEELFRLIFQGAYATVGEAVTAAKRVVTNRDLRRSWIFFGDPAMQLIGAPQPADVLTPASKTSRASAAVTASGVSDVVGATQPGATAAMGTDQSAPFSRLADFDGDGVDDVLLYASATGQWSALLSKGGGIRTATGEWPPHMQVFPARLNGDRLADVFLYNNETGDWLQALNNGDGSFRTYQNVWAPGWRARVGDFDGDSRDDVFLHDPDTGIWFQCLADGVGGFTYRSGDALPPGRLLVADFTGDSLADLFVYDATTGRWSLGVNNGADTFVYTSGQWSPGWTVTVANLDGDNRRDLLLFDPMTGEWAQAFTGRPGEFAYRRGRWLPGGQVHAVDFDGDGRDDVLRYDGITGQWGIGLNVSPGKFEYSGGSWQPGLTIAWGDLNGDGRADLLLYDPATGWWTRLMSRKPSGFTGQSGTWSTASSIVGQR